MKVCMPVQSDQGPESQVSGHFGSAPCFLIFDSDTLEFKSIENANQQHAHGQCNPLERFKTIKPDIVVVDGIGAGAFSKLQNAGIRVFKAEGKTVQENIDHLTTRGLMAFSADHSCAGHDHENGHHHHHPDGSGCHGHHTEGECCH